MPTPRLAAAVLCALAAAGPAAAQTEPPAPAHQLMPVPASLEWGSGRLRLGPGFTVSVRPRTDGRLVRAVAGMTRRLGSRMGVRLARAPVAASARATLVVVADGPGQAVQTPTEDESYVLEVGPSRATLRAPTTVGAIRGLETFLQLVEGGGGSFSVPAVRIQDRPRFPWRGVLIDVGRHFEPVEVILRNLDAMAAVKLNVLHWHLSDDQGFRVESRRFPRLHRLGSDGLFYTQAQIRRVVRYARDRGIRVVPEFDMPGHATSWFVGYPEYASLPGPYAIERMFGVFDPTFDPTREETYGFIDRFIGEMAALFPDPYWHVGGDENSGVQWNASARIREFKEQRGFATNEALQTYFNQRLLPILQRHGKRMVGWDEILQPGLPTTSVVQSWRGRASLDSAARLGYASILSSGYYLDHQRTAEFHYAVDPLPAGGALTEEEAARILGGEACMWAEHVGPETIDSRIWPRAAAIAERLWSPREITDVSDMYRRLEAAGARLEEVGVTHASHTGRTLRALAGGEVLPLLEALLEVVQPVYFWERSQLQHTSQTTPLDRLVDAARPDPPARHRIETMVDEFLADTAHAAHREDLARLFSTWQDIDNRLTGLASGTLRADVQEALPAAAALGELGVVGEDALRYLAGGAAPPQGWLERVTPVLDRAELPRGLLRVPIVPAMRRLATAAARP